MEYKVQHHRSYLLMAIIFICLGSALTRGTRRRSTAEVMDFKAKQFSYLNITVITSVFVPDGIECGFACLKTISCFSYNLNAFPDVNGKLLCELLPSDMYNNSDTFITSPIFHHFSIWSPCSSNPCKNNATCVANYKDDDYQCACSPGYTGEYCEIVFGKDCKEIKRKDESQVDGMYLLDPGGGNLSYAFWAYCDMTSYNGGWTMCYTTDEYVKLKTEVRYSAQFPYGSDGYRTDCNNIPFTEVIFVDHQTGNKAYFKRQNKQTTIATNIFGNAAATGLWDGVGTNSNFNYQLLVCDHSFYSGFFFSGYTNCYKSCNSWCGDTSSPYFRTASTDSAYSGVAFNINGHSPNRVSKRLISVGLR